jgi:hypothetical protein
MYIVHAKLKTLHTARPDTDMLIVTMVVLLAGNTTRLDGAAGLAALVWTPSIVK